MEDEYLKGVSDGWKRGKKEEGKEGLKTIGRISDNALGAATKARRDGDKEKAFYWAGYISGINNAKDYIRSVMTFG